MKLGLLKNDFPDLYVNSSVEAVRMLRINEVQDAIKVMEKLGKEAKIKRGDDGKILVVEDSDLAIVLVVMEEWATAYLLRKDAQTRRGIIAASGAIAATYLVAVGLMVNWWLALASVLLAVLPIWVWDAKKVGEWKEKYPEVLEFFELHDKVKGIQAGWEE